MFFKIINLEEIDSTNTYLLKNNNLPNFTFVTTNNQLKGRGRESKVWENEKGKDILFSFIIKDKSLILENKKLSIYCAYLVSKYLEKIAIKNVSIKWPNDVFVNDKKICGILLESKTNGEDFDFIVVGIGLNCNSEFNELNGFKYPPTSIKSELKKEQNIKKLLSHLMKFIYRNFLFKTYKKKKFFNYINLHNYLLNKRVTFNQNQIGLVLKINENFTLLIKEEGTGKEYSVDKFEINII